MSRVIYELIGVGEVGHQFRLPVAVMIDQASSGVPMGAFYRDIVDVGAAPLQSDHFILPGLPFEEPMGVQIVRERLAFALQREADFLLEDHCRAPGDMDVPGAVSLTTATRQHPKIEQDQLSPMSQGLTGGRENDPLRASMGVAVEVRAQERRDYRSRGAQDQGRDL
jgi:hypothetical protein